MNTFNSGRTFDSYSQLSWTCASSELVVPELSHSDIASYWHIVNCHLTWYSQACVIACQSVISGTFKNISQAKARVLPMVVATVVCMACIAVASSFIMSLAWVILRGGLVCTSILSTLCIVLRLACTSVLSTMCIRAPLGVRAYPWILSKYFPSVRPSPTDKHGVCILCVKQHIYVVF